MAQKDTRRAVALIYSTNGLPFGILTEVLPVLLRALGLGAATIGLASLLQLVWTAKVLWAPLVDRRATLLVWLRRSADVLALAFFAMAFCYAMGHRPSFFVATAVCAAAAATLDIAADALFVRLVASGNLNESGGGGLRTTAYKAGMMLGAGLTIAAAGVVGFAAPLAALGVWVAVVRRRALAAAVLSSSAVQAPLATGDGWQRAMLAWLCAPTSWPLLAFIFAYKLALASAAPMAKVAAVDHGMPLVSVGATLGLVGFLGTTVGAGTAVVCMRRYGLNVALLLGSASEVAACLGYGYASFNAPMGLGGWPYWAACSLLEAIAQGLTTTALGLLMTRRTLQRFAATHFSLLTSLFGLTRAVGGPLGGFAASLCGLTTFFFLAPLLAVLGLWPLYLLWPTLPKRDEAVDAL